MKTIILDLHDTYNIRHFDTGDIIISGVKKILKVKENPWCENCDEKDCLVGGDDYCEMIRQYKIRKENIRDLDF